MGGGVKPFQHINEQQATTALSQRQLFLCQICTREAFPTILHYLAQNLFFDSHIALPHATKYTKKKNRAWNKMGVNLKRYIRPWSCPLRKRSTFRTPDLFDFIQSYTLGILTLIEHVPKLTFGTEMKAVPRNISWWIELRSLIQYHEKLNLWTFYNDFYSSQLTEFFWERNLASFQTCILKIRRIFKRSI